MATRTDVLDAALALLHDGGADALSMRRLAEALGVSYQVVYSRVGGKGEVVRALHDDGFAALRAQVVELERYSDPRERVHAVARAYLDHALADPVLFRIMFGAPLPAFERDAAAREVEAAAFRACWVGPVRDHLDATRPDRPRGSATRLAWRCWTTVHGVTTVHLAGHPSPGDDPWGEVAALVDLLLDAPVA